MVASEMENIELGTKGGEWKLNIFCISFEHLEYVPGAYILSKMKTIKNTIEM